MKKGKRNLVLFALMCAVILNMDNRAYAVITGSMRVSPANITTGVWWSGLDNQQITSISGTYNNIYGGDVGIYIYETSVGMLSGCRTDTPRTASIELNEYDSANSTVWARTYNYRFGYNSLGVYQIKTLYSTDTNSAKIESDPTAELYIRIMIRYVNGDTTRNVPRGLFKYKYWIN